MDSNIGAVAAIELTATQKKAVESDRSRIAVIAGPGSGKTRVLTERIISLITEKGVSEQAILALSFSSKAANEMKKRLCDRLGNQAYRIEAKTFHSFGLQLIRNNYDLIGLSDEFEILNSTTKNKYLRDLLKNNHISESEIGIYAQKISAMKNGDKNVEYKFCNISKSYNDTIHANNCIDFDDMVTLAVQILKDNPSICASYRKNYSHILIDEVQDLNTNQMEMIKLLLDTDTSLFVVGDDDQCIYEWRGAQPDFLRNLASGGEFEVIKLEDNFRSDKAIVDVSNYLINNNQNRISKRMQSNKRKKDVNVTINAGSTQAMRFRSAEYEAQYIATEIEALLRSGYDYSDIAILIRGAKQAPPITTELARLNIPCFEQISDYTVYDELIPILRSITKIKAKLAINRAINYPVQIIDNFMFIDLQQKFGMDNSLSVFDAFEKLASNGKDFENCDIFRARFSTLTELNANYKRMTSHEVLLRLYSQYSSEKFAYSEKTKEKMEHFKTLIDIAKDFDKIYDPTKTLKSNFEEFIDYISLSSQEDTSDNGKTDGVNLMTCHKSKGLEFPVVFIPGVQVGVFPNDFFISTKEDLEAERRLFYVSMTRAIDKLYVTCYSDPFYGNGIVKKGFMAEIPNVIIK